LLGSYDKVEAAIKWNFSLLSRDTHTVKLNIAFLQQCGLTCDDIADLYAHGRTGNLINQSLEHVKKMVAHVEKLSMRRCSTMFKKALVTICNQDPESIRAKMEFLERALGYSGAKIAVRRMPTILCLSEVTLNHKVKFLTMEFGLHPSYIARRPAILTYSLEKRLIPRHYVIHILKAKGLVKEDIDLFNIFCHTHDKFVEWYLHRQ
jgi:mTERF domain-containing protein